MPAYHDARTSAATDTAPAQGWPGFVWSRAALTGAVTASLTPRAALISKRVIGPRMRLIA